MRYADDIVLLAKSERAAKRLLETSTTYLENKLKLTVNRKKSKVTGVYAIRNFKFLGRAEWMAIPQNTYEYMEDVEKAEVEDEVSDEAWDTEVLCTYGG